jgi:sulfatase modifying factor 1
MNNRNSFNAFASLALSGFFASTLFGGAITVSPGGVITNGTTQLVAVSGTTPNGKTFASYVTGTNPVAYFDLSTGSLMLDPKSRDVNIFDFRWGTFVAISSTTPGPFPAVVPGPGPEFPRGSWASQVTFPARLAGTISLLNTPSLATTGDNIASTNGWFNLPWSFGAIGPGLTQSLMYSTLDGQGFRAIQSNNVPAPVNLLGYGNGIGMFTLTAAGVAGNQYGAVIPIQPVPEPSTWVMAACGLVCAAWWRRKQRARTAISFALLSLVAACLAAGPSQAVTIDMVTVGNPGNANDPATGSLYGGVAYEYQIGKYAVTIGQYTAFLNSVARTDTYSLYSPTLASDPRIAGIARSGSSGAYSYSVMDPAGYVPPSGVTAANRPVTCISWLDAARFANWMGNGQPTGQQDNTTTENGTYYLNGAVSGTSFAPARNATNPNTGAPPLFMIPTENEWYKAAYYSPLTNAGEGGYYSYATQSNIAPGNVLGPTANQANCVIDGRYSVTQSGTTVNQNYLTDVGAFGGSGSFYGTFDQTGSVFEWNDLTGVSSRARGQRGGAWAGAYSSSFRNTSDKQVGLSQFNGFRLAAPVAVPEPSTYAMALAGVACGGFSMWRRRKRA